MRTLSFFILLALGLSVYSQNNVYLNENFEDGIPKNFVLKDYNDDPVVPTDFKGGRVNNTWSDYAVDSNEIRAAICSSRGGKGIATDRWMITPSIKIASGQAWLSWDAKSIHYDLRDGYSVMISTTDQSRESFKEVYRVDAEDYFWAHHFVSLKEYQGKDIYVAFVNNSYQKYILAVTNLFIGIPSPGEFEVIDETPRFVGDITAATAKGKLRNLGGTVKLDELACITSDGQELKQTYDQLILEPGATADFEYALPVSVGNVSGYTLKVTTDVHTRKEVLKDSVVCSVFPMTLVAEERTGTWCNSCPKGMLYMQMLKRRYKDQIVTVAIHNDDKMEFKTYDKWMGRWIFDLPGFIYNRNSSSVYYPSPNYKYEDEKLAQAILKPVEAKIELEVGFDNRTDANVIPTNAKITFAKELDNSTDQYRLGYAIVEKWVNGYGQQNSLGLPVTKEFNFLPSYIPPHLIYYHDIPRGVESVAEGITGSLPETIQPFTEYTFDYSVEIPETVGNPDNISVVVFVLDTKSRNILNACEVVSPNLGATNIEESNQTDPFDPIVYQSADKQVVHIQLPAEFDGAKVYVQLTGLDGRSIFAANVKSRLFTIPVNRLKGCYVLNMVIDRHIVSRKIMLK